ncbi:MULTISPECIES: multiubiquitin domain-containing protein [Fischerella]|uniref:multiubiquitin domain-containing protein n=1 Tax=Fischerella TaxID=1190 RepID=UPI00037C2C54|nr:MULTISPECIES: multiubiquitin domain-containing protein [Fischerella]MBD2432405.1 multiubiquitin domain-containing protein [Fischerella sp. FACHB-380]
MNSPQENKHEEKGSNKDFTIIVNARQKVVTAKHLSFTEIVALAFDNLPTGPNIVFTVTYRKGEGNKPEGTLVEGETVKIKDGMIFNVTATDKS